jgi:hypothetical protein
MTEPKNIFKENWNKVDETCNSCGQVTKRVRGLTKQNLKRLITPRWDLNEVLITFMLIMVIVLAFTYKSETQLCRNWVEPMFENEGKNCNAVCDARCELVVGVTTMPPNYTYPKINTTLFLNELNGTTG